MYFSRQVFGRALQEKRIVGALNVASDPGTRDFTASVKNDPEPQASNPLEAEQGVSEVGVRSYAKLSWTAMVISWRITMLHHLHEVHGDVKPQNVLISLGQDSFMSRRRWVKASLCGSLSFGGFPEVI